MMMLKDLLKSVRRSNSKSYSWSVKDVDSNLMSSNGMLRSSIDSCPIALRMIATSWLCFAFMRYISFS